jgi:hypothetical protein
MSPLGADAQMSQPAFDSVPALGTHEAGVEFFRPHFRSEDGFSMGSMSAGLLLVWGRPISRRIALRAELPVAWGSTEPPPFLGDASASGTVIGNPALNVRAVRGGASAAWFEGEVRIPVGTATFSDPGALVGFMSDPTVVERWAEDVTTLSAGIGSRWSLPSGVDVELTGSVGYWRISGADPDSDPFGRYAAGVHRVGESITASAVLRGVVFLGEDAGNVMDRLIHTIEGELGTGLGRSRVGAFVRVPLKDLIREVSPFTLGLRLAVPLG